MLSLVKELKMEVGFLEILDVNSCLYCSLFSLRSGQIHDVLYP